MNETTRAMDWRHPGTMTAPTSVLVCALGPSRNEYIGMQSQHEPPAKLFEEVDEVWGLNCCANLFNGRIAWDVLFVMDYLDGEAARFPRYGQHLRKWCADHDRTIITSVPGTFEDVALAYPLREVVRRMWDTCGANMPYFHNSIPYILAYAWFIGVKRLVLFGVDYDHPQLGNKYEAQRPCAEFWVGWCRGQGMQVVLSEASTLLNSSNARWFYGYPVGPERVPRLDEDSGLVTVPGVHRD